MFSQMECNSCLAAIPLRTNSTTACEDWQSQIPARFNGQLTILQEDGKVFNGTTNRRKQRPGIRHPLRFRASLLQGKQ
jgi:hypothetical protein